MTGFLLILVFVLIVVAAHYYGKSRPDPLECIASGQHLTETRKAYSDSGGELLVCRFCGSDVKPEDVDPEIWELLAERYSKQIKK